MLFLHIQLTVQNFNDIDIAFQFVRKEPEFGNFSNFVGCYFNSENHKATFRVAMSTFGYFLLII